MNRTFTPQLGPAVLFAMSGQLNELVKSVVEDLLMPVVFKPALAAAHVDDIRQLSFNGIHYGKVIGTFIDFMIVAWIVFLFSKLVLKEGVVAVKK